MHSFSRTHSHSGVKRSGNLVVLLEPGTATKDLWQPELANGAFHVANLPLAWWRCLDPLGRLPADTTNHVGMGQSLWRPLSRLDIQGVGERLRDSRVERRSPAWDDQAGVANVSRGRPFASTGAEAQRRCHGWRLANDCVTEGCGEG